jgi:DNA processing protein
LLGVLAPYIARALDDRRRLPTLLALGEDDLIGAACGRRREEVESTIARFDPEAAREAAAKAGLGAVCTHCEGFPELLRNAEDAPAMLYVRGKGSLLNGLRTEPAVAVVGSRRPSPYGVEVAHRLSRELAACGVPIISGMALGIDAAAHEGALAAPGATVAVLASGADRAYPRSKRGLYDRLAEEGLIVSELPPRSSPHRWCFPARNRIMAALARMTIVVEGTESSGSLITARFAADLGRDVGGVPGQVTSPLAAGPNQLIADGATVVRGARDVLDVLWGAGAGAAALARQSMPELEPRLAQLLEAVEQGKGSIDAIARDSGDVPEALAGLTELELLGLVRRGPTGTYQRCA